jgi:co-chaperonin GroES (HSP10)
MKERQRSLSKNKKASVTDEETNATIGTHQMPTPLNSKVLVQPVSVSLSDSSKDNEEYPIVHGTLLSLGDLAYPDRDTGTRWQSETCPKVGDRVTYGTYAGQKIVVKGVKFLLLNDDEVTLFVPHKN